MTTRWRDTADLRFEQALFTTSIPNDRTSATPTFASKRNVVFLDPWATGIGHLQLLSLCPVQMLRL